MNEELQKVLDKVAGTKVGQVNKVAVAYSGGLDSTLCCDLATRKYGAKEVYPITVDVGQGDEEIKEMSQKRARMLGFREPILMEYSKKSTRWSKSISIPETIAVISNLMF